MNRALLPLLLMAALAHAEAYTLADLQSLVKSRQFAEACAHLLDVPPTLRNAEWTEVATQALLGRVKQLDGKDETCGESMALLETLVDRIPALGDRPEVKAILVSTGVCAVGKVRFYDRSARDKLAQATLKLDEHAIRDLALKARWDGAGDGHALLRHMGKNPDRYAADELALKYLKELAKVAYMDEPKEEIALKFQLLKKYKLYDGVMRELTEQVRNVSQKMQQGERKDSDQALVAVRQLKAAGALSYDLAVGFYLPHLLCGGNSNFDEAMEALAAAPKKELAKLEQRLIESKPGEPYWFCGGAPEERDRRLRSLVPRLTQVARAECAAFKKDKKPLVHMDQYDCDRLLKAE